MSRKRVSVLLALAAMAGAVACGGSSSKNECKVTAGSPTDLASTGRTATTVALSWTAPAAPAHCSITGYTIFDGGVQVALATSNAVEVVNLASNQVHSFTVAARDGAGQSEPSEAVQVTTLPDLGPSTHIYDPSMAMADIQADIDAVYAPQFSDATGQFNGNRYALLFKPGAYTVDVPVGYYMQVLGLGAFPDDVTITGRVHSEGHWSGGASKYNATQNFWRGLENFAVVPTANVGTLPVSGEADDGGVYMRWAVSQACPFRRMHVKGDIDLWQGPKDGWSSGGWMSDSKVDGVVNSGSQQQWFARNSEWTTWNGINWNHVFMGDTNMPAGAWPGQHVTRIAATPMVREKPFLHVDEAGDYFVFVPSLTTDTSGATWSGGTQTPGTDQSILDFFVARPSDSATDINAALAAGKSLLFTPGIYHLDGTIEVTRAGTVVLGMGLATLHPDTGLPAMTVADVGGVVVAGVLFDAGSINSPVLLQAGAAGAAADHSASPTILQDLFFRIGGAEDGKATVALEINSRNVIGDHFWIWRADHGTAEAPTGWDVNTSDHGLVVNGADVTIYGLFCEHFQKHQTLWNADGGRVYFYQSEIPYDVPDQASWMNGTVKGYASYKVADTVTQHEAWGLGVYSVFNVFDGELDNAIEVPTGDAIDVKLHGMITFGLSKGIIHNVINGVGGPATSGATPALGGWQQGVVAEYPVPPPPPAPPGLVFPLNFESAPNVAYQLPNWGSGVSSSVIVDPQDDTNHVAHWVKPAGSETWGGFNVDRDTATSTGLDGDPFLVSKTFTVRVRCDKDSVTVLLKIEHWGNTASVEVPATTGVGTAGTWQTLSYDFTSKNPDPGIDYLRLDLFPGFGSTDAVTCDLDDVTQVVP